MFDNIDFVSENLGMLEPILMYVVAISLITNLAVWVFKSTFPTFNNRFLPLVATIIGILVGLLSIIVPELTGDLSVGGHILAGAISGIFATKTYDAVLKPTKEIIFKEDKKKL